MKKEEILKLISTAKEVDINKIHCENPKHTDNLKVIYDFIQTLNEGYFDLVEHLMASNVRFCDYYDVETMHGQEIVEYFKENYTFEDCELQSEVFALYVMLKGATDLVFNFDLCDTLDELYELLDNNQYFNDILYMMSYMKEKKNIREADKINELPFLNQDTRFKILFTGFAPKDIQKLEKPVKKTLINKISNQLAVEEVIPLAEEVGHVKDAFGFPLFRIQFANDYRIAYVRKGNVTAIIGVTLKTGKEIDYTRYDAIAKNSDKIYLEMQMLEQGILPEDSSHFSVIENLKEFYSKNK